jgi:hypothetical protein
MIEVIERVRQAMYEDPEVKTPIALILAQALAEHPAHGYRGLAIGLAMEAAALKQQLRGERDARAGSL